MKIEKTEIMGCVGIFIVVVVVDLIRFIRIKCCRIKLWRNFKQGKFEDIKTETTIRKIKRKYNNASSTYNDLCWLLASIALMKGEEECFLIELNQVKKEKQYAHKSYVFALYYRAKQNYSVARTYYQTYCNSRGRNRVMDMVMTALFSMDEVLPIDQCVKISMKNTTNPALQKLYLLNNIIAEEPTF